MFENNSAGPLTEELCGKRGISNLECKLNALSP